MIILHIPASRSVLKNILNWALEDKIISIITEEEFLFLYILADPFNIKNFLPIIQELSRSFCFFGFSYNDPEPGIVIDDLKIIITQGHDRSLNFTSLKLAEP